MPSICEFKNVPFTDISITSKWNLTPFLDLNSISTSDTSEIHVGNIHPPIVKVSESLPGTYTLISGRSRLQSVKKNSPKQSHITVLVLPADISANDILLYLLSDKNVSGNFSKMEKSFFLHLCCENRSLEEISQKFLPLLDEKPQTHIAKKLISLTTLEPNLQKSIHNGQLSSKLALELLTLSAIDRVTLHNLFKQLELGGGKQKRLYSLCKDLSLRNNTDITTLLTNEDYRSILNHSEMNVPQKGASLLTLLQKQLFPQNTEAEKKFIKRVRNIHLPDNCTVKHSQSFELEEISVIIKFKDIGKLEEKSHIFKELLD